MTAPDTTTATMIIAIDGPSAAGKSTLAKSLAEKLGLTFLDTGAMYRAVTLAVLDRGVAPSDERGCAEVARALHLTFDAQGHIWIDGRAGEPDVRSSRVTQAVSEVSAHPAVRRVVVPWQRREAEARGGIVAEGRDTTSVVFPEADVKFYLDASAEERARRRSSQMGRPDLYAEILREQEARDLYDSSRADSPLVCVEDAIVIASDGKSIVDLVREMLSHVERLRRARA